MTRATLFFGMKIHNNILRRRPHSTQASMAVNLENDNMKNDFIAKASISLKVPPAKVWDALVNPETIKQYMFGTDVESNWRIGSPIIWRGLWDGKVYEDKGVILKLESHQILQYSHFSPLSGLPDITDHYHTVTIELSSDELHTHLSLSQDNNRTDKEREYSEKMWESMLVSLKTLLEK
jgi:uncharacterized protein YndB with AHSA1/START domain